MWGWIVLALVLGVFFIPMGVVADYDENGIGVRLKIGFVGIRLYPRKKTKGNKKEKKKSAAKAVGKSTDSEESQGGKLSDFLPLLRTLLDFLGNLRRRITIQDLRLKLILAGGDPCDMSIHYGRAWAAVGSLLPQLERLFQIKKRNVEIACDYVADETAVLGHVHISILPIRLIALVVRFGIRMLKQYSTIKNQRKGGNGYEPKTPSNA